MTTVRATEGSVRVRPLEAGETWVVREVFAGLSEASRQRRFHAPVERLTPAMVAALTAVDDRDHVALVAEAAEEGLWRPVGIGRLVRTDGDEAELAIEVTDAWQGRGVGGALLRALRERAPAAGMTQVIASILVGNQPMLDLWLRTFPDTWIVSDGRTWEARATVPALASLPPSRPAAGRRWRPKRRDRTRRVRPALVGT